MATTTYAAYASGPISFYDPATGKHISIPLTDITFSGGAVAASLPSTGVWTPTLVAGVSSWIKYLASVGAIVPGPTQ